MNKMKVRIFIFSLSVIFIVVGYLRGEHGVLLSKAIRICLECVGIG